MPTSVSFISNNSAKTSIFGSASTIPSNFLSTPNSLYLQSNVLTALNDIQSEYAINNAQMTYQNIPSSYDTYLTLYNNFIQIESDTPTGNLKNIFKTVEYALVGAMNANKLNMQYIRLEIENGILEKRITDILSNINTLGVIGGATGNFAASRTFKFIPLYSYYIMVYGLPAYGEGFDINKVSLIKSILLNMNIDPYNATTTTTAQ